MRQLSLTALMLWALIACNTATTSTGTKDTTAAATTSNKNISYAYPIQYASEFTIGDSKYAQAVLLLWKDYDNNTLDNHKDIFADSVDFFTADGNEVKGPRDSVLNALKAYRSSFANAVSSVDVVVSLKPKGKEESWVNI